MIRLKRTRIPPAPDTPGAFTLIELLVVMSVVTLLLGLLLPALARGRRTARAAQCMSRLREHGVALNLYVLDYGALPHEDDSSHPEIICWYYAVNRYLGVIFDESMHGQDAHYPDIKICPEVDRTATAFMKGYRFNSGLESNARPFMPLEWIRITTTTPILFDAQYTGAGLSFKGRENKVDARHDKSANILFADWHVDSVAKESIDTLTWHWE